MPPANRAALEFLLTRRSRPAKTLGPPFPDDAALQTILTAAARTPDHGKLEPWRFIVLRGAALVRLAALSQRIGQDQERPDSDIAKMVSQFRDSGCAVAVIESPRMQEKVPLLEQTYSAGAVCLSLLNAALASGWGANWLSGWAAHDGDFAREGLDLAEHERVAGFIHIGTESGTPPERPRPDLDRIAIWIDT